MAKSVRYIVVYDVRDADPSEASSRRKSIHWRMKKIMTPIQRSVFEGGLTKAQLGKVQAIMIEKIKPNTDSVKIFKQHSTKLTEAPVFVYGTAKKLKMPKTPKKNRRNGRTFAVGDRVKLPDGTRGVVERTTGRSFAWVRTRDWSSWVPFHNLTPDRKRNRRNPKGLKFTVKRDGASNHRLRLRFEGKIGRTAVRGYMYGFFIGIDPPTYKVIRELTTINRAEGRLGSPPLSYNVREKVLKEVLAEVKRQSAIKNRRNP